MITQKDRNSNKNSLVLTNYLFFFLLSFIFLSSLVFIRFALSHKSLFSSKSFNIDKYSPALSLFLIDSIVLFTSPKDEGLKAPLVTVIPKGSNTIILFPLFNNDNFLPLVTSLKESNIPFLLKKTTFKSLSLLI